MDKISDRNKDNVNTSFNTYYKDKKFRLIDFPKTFIIDTVSCCNLRCSMCVHKEMKRKKDFMDWDIFTKAIDEIAIKNKDAKIWMVFFGDPFVRAKYKPTIFDMVKYAKDKGLTNVVINTNGCLMNEENIRKIIDAGIDGIYIGIDGFSEKSYNQNRCGGNYQETVNNVLTLLKIKKELNLDKLNVYVQFVEMDNNINERDAFIDFWTKAGANVKIRPMVTWAGKIKRQIMTETLTDRQPCSWAMTTMIIADDGRIATCACDLDVSHNFGNIKNRSLEDIWQHEILDFRKKHIEKRFDELPELCKNCRDWQSSGEKIYYTKQEQ